MDRYCEGNRVIYIEKGLSHILFERDRTFKGLIPVPYDPASCGDLYPKWPVYDVCEDLYDEGEGDMLLKHGLRWDVTIMPPMMLGRNV